MVIQRIWMLSAILFCGMALTSWSNKDEAVKSPDDSISENLADVTIIYYGCGGGTLDGSNIKNLREFYQAKPESFKNVKIVMQYKFSKTKEFSPEEAELLQKEGSRKVRPMWIPPSKRTYT